MLRTIDPTKDETPDVLTRPRDRVVGRVGTPGAEPRVLVTCGLHGNEFSGVAAARRVLAAIQRKRLTVNGELLVLAGNLQALAADCRFVDRDLNRDWTARRISLARSRAAETRDAEDSEQVELIEYFARFVGDSTDVLFVDLHTSSAVGAPFATIGDTLRNRRFVLNFPLPIILGLEEQVDDSLLEYLNNRGCLTLGIEAGQHVAPESTDYHESAIWIALVRSGILREPDVDLAGHRSRLAAAVQDVPAVLEVRRRHAVVAGDGFVMRPGYRNFTHVKKGEPLADDASGPILAPESGRILLPLYQTQGDDGFFICREFSPFWLNVSSALRRLRLGRAMHFLPGVRRENGEADLLRVDTRVARIYPLQIFHLLGFRKLRQDGPVLTVSRRRFDLRPPARIRVEESTA